MNCLHLLFPFCFLPRPRLLLPPPATRPRRGRRGRCAGVLADARAIAKILYYNMRLPLRERSAAADDDAVALAAEVELVVCHEAAGLEVLEAELPGVCLAARRDDDALVHLVGHDDAGRW